MNSGVFPGSCSNLRSAGRNIVVTTAFIDHSWQLEPWGDGSIAFSMPRFQTCSIDAAVPARAGWNFDSMHTTSATPVPLVGQ
jgi:hypothetical protein